MCYIKLTHVLVKAVRISAKTVGKDSSCESGVSIDRKTTIYRLKLRFFEKEYQAIHSNAFLHFTDLPVSSTLYHLAS